MRRIAVALATLLTVLGATPERSAAESDVHYRGAADASLNFSSNVCLYTYEGPASIVAEATQEGGEIVGLLMEAETSGIVASSCTGTPQPFRFFTYTRKGERGRAGIVDDDGNFCCLGYRFGKSEVDVYDRFRIVETDGASAFLVEVEFEPAYNSEWDPVLRGTLRFTADPTPVEPATWGAIKRLLAEDL
jgi:hypothetical protein